MLSQRMRFWESSRRKLSTRKCIENSESNDVKRVRGERSPLEKCLYQCFIIGCAISASDGSSPQVYVRLLAVGHRLEVEFREKVLYPKRFQSNRVRGVYSPLERVYMSKCCVVPECLIRSSRRKFSTRKMLLSSLDIGCAISASDGSSPQVYVRLLAVEHRLERNISSGLLESSLSKVCQSNVTW